MRQNFKDKKYFEEIIDKEIENINIYEEKYLKKKEERGESYKGEAFSTIIYSGLDIVISSRHSIGYSISELAIINNKMMQYYLNTIDELEDYSDGGSKDYAADQYSVGKQPYILGTSIFL